MDLKNLALTLSGADLACGVLHGVDLSLDGMSLLDANGAVCIYTLVGAHYIVDVSGVLPTS